MTQPFIYIGNNTVTEIMTLQNWTVSAPRYTFINNSGREIKVGEEVQGFIYEGKVYSKSMDALIDKDPICETELFAELKLEIGQILFNKLGMNKEGTAIEANPATHAIAKKMYHRLVRSVSQPEKENQKMMKIYIASKTKHADKWLKLRAEGVNVISTWIDEAGEGKTKDKADLCFRCINEVIESDAVIVYHEEGDMLVGAYIEMGVALGIKHKPVFIVGSVLRAGSVFNYSHQIFSAESVHHAIKLINKIP